MHRLARYSYVASTHADEDGHYIGTCTEFPSLSWFSNTREGAIFGITSLVRDVLEQMLRDGETPPAPGSGKEP